MAGQNKSVTLGNDSALFLVPRMVFELQRASSEFPAEPAASSEAPACRIAGGPVEGGHHAIAMWPIARGVHRDPCVQRGPPIATTMPPLPCAIEVCLPLPQRRGMGVKVLASMVELSRRCVLPPMGNGDSRTQAWVGRSVGQSSRLMVARTADRPAARFARPLDVVACNDPCDPCARTNRDAPTNFGDPRPPRRLRRYGVWRAHGLPLTA